MPTSQFLAIDTNALPWEERFSDQIGKAIRPPFARQHQVRRRTLARIGRLNSHQRTFNIARGWRSNDSQAPLRHRVGVGTVASFRTWRGSRLSLAQDPAISGRQPSRGALLIVPVY